MLDNIYINWTIGIVATIILGAIGSGFWEIALKPIIRFTSFKLMSLTAFVFKTWKMFIYRSIGNGETERPLLLIIFLVNIGLMSPIIISIFKSVYIIEYKVIESDEIIENIFQEKLPEELHEMYLKEKYKSSFFDKFILDRIFPVDPSMGVEKIKLLIDILSKLKTEKDYAKKKILKDEILKISIDVKKDNLEFF